jgi:murein endopeptidase
VMGGLKVGEIKSPQAGQIKSPQAGHKSGLMCTTHMKN